jgi:hypothetical protein
MEYLYDMGHRHIGYVGHQHNESKTTLSYRAYQAFLQDRGLKQREEYSHFGSFETAGPEAWTQWQHLKIRPTAAICTADVIALSLMQEVVATGRRVPQDLSVVGHDDIAAAARMKLTTIRIDPTAFAFAVASLLERPGATISPKWISAWSAPNSFCASPWLKSPPPARPDPINLVERTPRSEFQDRPDPAHDPYSTELNRKKIDCIFRARDV